MRDFQTKGGSTAGSVGCIVIMASVVTLHHKNNAKDL